MILFNRDFLRHVYSKLLDLMTLNRVWTKRASSARPSKVAIICIAKDEDPYIEEWINYHLKLGVSDIFVYQNDWRADKRLESEHVHLLEFDGSQKQMEAYNHFISTNGKNFDFGIFIDVDEYICLVHDQDIKDFLARYAAFPAVGLNWRIFGDSGIKDVMNDDYSLVTRFVRCGRTLNAHIKTIVNFNKMPSGSLFKNPHFIENPNRLNLTVSVDCRYYIHGPWNRHFSYDIAWINHYWTKTYGEFLRNKIKRGRSDLPRNSPCQHYPVETFEKFNINEVENLTAKNFYLS